MPTIPGEATDGLPDGAKDASTSQYVLSFYRPKRRWALAEDHGGAIWYVRRVCAVIRVEEWCGGGGVVVIVIVVILCLRIRGLKMVVF